MTPPCTSAEVYTLAERAGVARDAANKLIDDHGIVRAAEMIVAKVGLPTFVAMIRKRRAAGRPAYPIGRPFSRFPSLTTMTFGLQGIFVIVGATGVGKSTLAAHLAA